MKSPDEVLEYLNKRDDRTNYQVHCNYKPWIYIQYPNGILLFVDVKDQRIAFYFNQIKIKELNEMDRFLQELQQAMDLGNSLKEFLQSP